MTQNNIVNAKILLLLIPAIALISGTSKTKTDPLLIGIYRITGFNSGQSLVIEPDQQFIFQQDGWEGSGGGEVSRVRGNYTIRGHKLILKPEYFIHVKYDTNNQEVLPIDSTIYHPGSSLYSTSYAKNNISDPGMGQHSLPAFGRLHHERRSQNGRE